jgi:phosphoglycolate phosphatase
MLLATAERFAVAAAQLLMVGDGPADVASARAAGCPAAVVAWGYAGDRVAAGDGVLRIATPAELSALVRSGSAATPREPRR